jgi:histidinol phosphatase-like PHP family hydrolase
LRRGKGLCAVCLLACSMSVLWCSLCSGEIILTNTQMHSHSYPHSHNKLPTRIRQPLIYGNHSYTTTTHIRQPLIYNNHSYTTTTHIQQPLIYGNHSYTTTTHIRQPLIYDNHSYTTNTISRQNDSSLTK